MWSADEQARPDQALVGPDREKRPGEFRIRSGLDGVLLALQQPWYAQQLGALIDADEKFGLAELDLDRPELCAPDQARDGAELARRIDLRPDAASRILLDRNRKAVHPFMLRSLSVTDASFMTRFCCLRPVVLRHRAGDEAQSDTERRPNRSRLVWHSPDALSAQSRRIVPIMHHIQSS